MKHQKIPETHSMTVYSALSPLKNPKKLFREQWQDIKKAGFLGSRFFYRDITSLYRQTVLGYLWAFVPALLQAGIFIFLNKTNILNIETQEISYPFFVLIGITFYFIFSEALSAPFKEFESNRTMLARINFPKESLFFSGMGKVLYNYLVKMTLLCIALIIFGVPIKGSAFLAVIPVLTLLNLGVILGVVLFPIGALYNDIQQGSTIAATLFMYICPVVYPVPQNGLLFYLMKYNPLTYVILSYRNLLYKGTLEYFPLVCVFFVGSLVMLFLVLLLFRLSLPIVIERMES